MTIVSPEPQSTIPPTGNITFIANRSDAQFQCRLGSIVQDPCTSGVAYGPLTTGETFSVVVVASAPDSHAATTRTTYTVGAAAPTVTITSTPTGSKGEISFTFTPADATVRCHLDGEAIVPCASPQAYSDLKPGSHTFTVQALTDHAKSPSQSASWKVAPPGGGSGPSATVPRVTITSAPAPEVDSTHARLAFRGNAAADHFQCSRDNARFSPCSSPKTYDGLARSSHVFAVRAIGATGRVGPTVRTAWTVLALDDGGAGDDSGPSWIVLALAVLAALVAALLAGWALSQRVARSRRRVSWQHSAREEPPERSCREESRYCQKTAIKVKPGRRHIAYVDLHAHDGAEGELDKRVSRQVVERLNDALHAYRRHQRQEELQSSVLPAAALLVEEIEAWLRHDVVHDKVTTEAHLTSTEIEFEFTLFRCSRHDDGNKWDKEDKWQASLEQEGDDLAAEFHRPQALRDEVDQAVVQLAAFVARVDRPSALEVSGTLSARQ